ncbi:unnamed protein product [Didymodactylos carnosus]|uniref:G-protein coupled receptors family 1 profile domain-containing protein n=1 Tax=Didymodactylos carnosus TaxID=1234261 RepID=A0A814IWH9_9BILA|nr:unnamed protein product [Didymodactylos carnosus]CAF1028845.1 unnamed protein product [Didymodactylos carnosus]CAF3605959.1 unnamed protein product [Didymodactylos carnosus]CAF3799812.1 unnamed protein product [Didymodactylos carnosus]
MIFLWFLTCLFVDIETSILNGCQIQIDHIYCRPKFRLFHSTSLLSDLSRTTTLTLTNSYLTGSVASINIKTLIIEDYPYPIFSDTFESSSIEIIHIEHTRLTLFPQWLCKLNLNLTTIQIEYSQIISLSKNDFRSCTNLTTLRITYSHLTHFQLPCNGLSQLRYLFLNNNELTTIDTQGLIRLSTLDLSFNRIVSISSNIFKQASQLRILNLSYNSLEMFNIMDESHLKNLKFLYLQGNVDLKTHPNWRLLSKLIVVEFPYSYFCCAPELLKINYAVYDQTTKEMSNISELDMCKINETLNIIKTTDNYIETHTTTYTQQEIQYDTTIFNKYSGHPLFNRQIHSILKSNGALFGQDVLATSDTHRIMLFEFQESTVCRPIPHAMTPCRNLFSKNVIRLVFIVIVIMALSCNILAVLLALSSILTSYHSCSIATVLTSNLAVSDFLYSIYLMSVAIVDYQYAEQFYGKAIFWQSSSSCKIAGFLYTFSSVSSTYALTLLTIERFYTILFSFKRQLTWPYSITICLICFGWFCSFTIALVPLFGMNTFQDNTLCVPFRLITSPDRYFVLILISFGVSSTVIIIYCYGLICLNLSYSHIRTSNDLKATIKILILVSVDLISRFPLLIFLCIYIMGYYTLTLDDIEIIILFVQPLNTCLNPLMYSINKTKLKQEMWRIYDSICNRISCFTFIKSGYQAMRQQSIDGIVEYRAKIET